ncbi:acetyl-CoA acetyltransferase [Tsuneonella sp. YG55]|uniref:Acetyl-CoA acetyltransferase n=1 Tax=Tsuneonella litorea TaxID=2976475 RepID=A0A9X2W1E0_9SPHN|nr:acetyl-CoA acetyltransferase [Tsuneonella litorea]MCT2558952.1 acetyl-CoA acetyltransferase [Tsuneonella litorea]
MVQLTAAEPDDMTPVIVGVGQVVERIGDPGYAERSAADLAAWAAETALADACAAVCLKPLVEVVGAIRTFEDSRGAPAPFGKPDKFPLAVARRLGIAPTHAVLEPIGGQSPATAVVDIAERILHGEISAGLVFGAEATSTIRSILARGEIRDWAEHDEGEVEWKGSEDGALLSRRSIAHGIHSPALAYGLIENARRARTGLTRAEYRTEMGRLFAPFSEVAAANPLAATFGTPASAAELAEITPANRLIADPYPRKVISRDQVNMGAAALVMSVGAARAAGIDRDKWVHIHGAAKVVDPEPLERADLARFPGAEAVLDAALAASGKSLEEIDHLDFYSCFPAAVFATAIDHLGLSPDEPRRLTATGGLPFFGGPGNGYSGHAIATMAERLRAAPGSFGLVGALGGFQSKYAALVLSTDPAPVPSTMWRNPEVDRPPPPVMTELAEGRGVIETYTIQFSRDGPDFAVAIGRLPDGSRFIARSGDPGTLTAMVETDPLGAEVSLSNDGECNAFTWTGRPASVAAERRDR